MPFVDELFDPGAWRQLREWLLDRGHDPAFIEEDVVVFLDPMAPMLVDGAKAAVEATSPELLEEVVRYFRPTAERYLASWSSLREAQSMEDIEVVVPPTAVVSQS